jgi:putative ABC transport system substrate-binding protein
MQLKRREFIALLSGVAAAWPLAVRAQQRQPRVGILLPGRAVAARDLELARELERVGYSQGRNITYEVRGAEGELNWLPQLARELVAMNPDVIVGSSSPVADALAAATPQYSDRDDGDQRSDRAGSEQ